MSEKRSYRRHVFNFFVALFMYDLCICDDLMTVSRNHIADIYLFHNRNWILVATGELQDRLKTVHLGDLLFFFPPHLSMICAFVMISRHCSPITLLIPTYLIIEIGFW